MNFGAPPPAGLKKPKRYGWYREYFEGQWSDAQQMGRWRMVAQRSGATLSEVMCVKKALDACAALVKKHGRIDNFDIHECAAMFDIAPDKVAGIIRVLVDIEWLSRSHVIVDWLDRQPPAEDQTAAERQRNKRRRDEAKRRAAIGMANAEDLELLSIPEREALKKLAGLSRVTPEPDGQQPEHVGPFVPIEPDDQRPITIALVEESNQKAARRWLLGTGEQLATFGPASAIVADGYGCTRITADGMIRDWLQQRMEGKALPLATIISGAYEMRLSGEGFRGVVEQRMTAWAKERNASLPLPFGPTSLRGGRAS